MSQNNEDDIISIESLDDFAVLVAGWHHNRLTQLDMALNAPDGVEIEFSLNEGEPPVVMNAEHLAGFKAGLALAKSLFGTLPFVPVKVEDASTADENPEGQLNG